MLLVLCLLSLSIVVTSYGFLETIINIKKLFLYSDLNLPYSVKKSVFLSSLLLFSGITSIVVTLISFF